jgi:hypothetical protein
MKTQTLVGVAASVALNFIVLAGLDWSAREAQAIPEGVVSITQLGEVSELEIYAALANPAAGARL